MDNEPTTLFESYEGDFLTLINGVRDKLEGEAKEQRGGTIGFVECF
jgi:vesicle transport through interaction with t-SNAREs 1